ncbi:hypothetical protein JI435_304320, partial [Parastagonospora nodorum SN15]
PILVIVGFFVPSRGVPMMMASGFASLSVMVSPLRLFLPKSRPYLRGSRAGFATLTSVLLLGTAKTSPPSRLLYSCCWSVNFSQVQVVLVSPEFGNAATDDNTVAHCQVCTERAAENIDRLGRAFVAIGRRAS